MRRSLSLPCAKCGRLAVTVTVPGVPSELRGFLSGILRTAGAFLALRGINLPLSALPSSGHIFDAITPEQLPAIAAAIDATCSSCSSSSRQADGAA